MSHRTYAGAVNPDHQRSYEEFLQDPELLETKREVSLLRTVIFQFLENMQKMADARIEKFADKVRRQVELELGMPPFEMDESSAHEWATWFSSRLAHPFEDVFGRISGIGHKELKSVSSACKDLSKLLEVEMSLQKGQVLTLEGNVDDIHYILRHGVFPLITHAQRKAIIHNIKELIKERFVGADQAFDMNVDDVPEDGEYTWKEEDDATPLLPPMKRA